jgi:hypothetical protein
VSSILISHSSLDSAWRRQSRHYNMSLLSAATAWQIAKQGRRDTLGRARAVLERYAMALQP